MNISNKIINYLNRNRSEEFIGIQCSYCLKHSKIIVVKTTSLVVPICKDHIEYFFVKSEPIYKRLKKEMNFNLTIKDKNGRERYKNLNDF